MEEVLGLVVMDVDSTVIREEGIDLLAKECGVYERVKKITKEAMEGKIDFSEALKKRVALLAGLDVEVFSDIFKKIHLTYGAKELVEELHKRKFKVGLVSGGFYKTVTLLAKNLGVDYYKAIELEEENSKLTGKVVGEIVTKETKKNMLEKWAKENNLPLSKTVAVGDGANDIYMIQTAGVGIAFNAKDIVKKNALYQINEYNLLKVLDIIDEVFYNKKNKSEV